MWFILGILSALGLGCYDIFKKLSVKENAVIPVLFCSILCSSLILLPLLVLSRAMPTVVEGTMLFIPPVSIQTHGYIFLKSAIVLTSWICAYFAMKHLPITLVTPINATRPIWTLLGALLIFQERLSGWQWVGVGVVLCSFVAFSVVGKKEGISFRRNRWIVLLMVATVTGAISGLYDKHLMRQFDPMAVQAYYTFYQCGLMAIMMVVLWYPNRKHTTPFKWRYTILCISIFLVLSDFLYFSALTYPDSLISVLSTVRRAGVVVPFAYGAVILKDKNIKPKTVCLIGIVAGVILLSISVL